MVSSIFLLLLSLFNGEARNSILTKNENLTKLTSNLVRQRIILIPALIFTGIILSQYYSNYSRFLIFAIIIRKSLDWLDELILVREVKKTEISLRLIFYTLSQIILYALLIISALLEFKEFLFIYVFLALWAFSPFILNNLTFIYVNTKSVFKTKNKISFNASHYFSSIIIAAAALIFRIQILKNSNDIEAGNLITAFALGNIFSAVTSSPIGAHISSKYKKKTLKLLLLLIPIFFSILICTQITDFYFLNKDTYFWKTLIYTFGASGLLSYSIILRNKKIQEGLKVLRDDFFVSFLNLLLCFVLIHFFLLNYLSMFMIFSAIINYMFYSRND